MSYLDRNIEALQRRMPHLAESIKEGGLKEPPSGPIHARSGDLTYKVDGEGRWGVWIHSRVDPRMEAKKLVSEWRIKGKRVVLLGFGIGYPLFELFERTGDNQEIIAIEKEIVPFLLSIKMYDWREILSSPRVRIFIGEKGDRFCFDIPEGVTILRYEPAIRAFPTYYCGIERMVNGLLGRDLVSEKLRIITFTSKRNPITQDITDALIDLGQTVLPIPFLRMDGRDARSLFEKAVSSFRPDLIITNNTIGLSPSIIDKIKIPICLWQTIEPSNFSLPPPSKNLYIFCPDHTGVKILKERGYKEVRYLPLATNPKVFRPIPLSKEDRKRYGCGVSFAGACEFSIGYREHKELFERFFTKDVVERMIKGFSMDGSRSLKDIYSEILKEREGLPPLDKARRYLKYIEYEALSRYRKAIIKETLQFDLKLYGNSGWEEIAPGHYHGWIDNRTDLPKLYNATQVNLNIILPRDEYPENLNMRAFDIPACRGFMLVNFRKDLLRLFCEDEISYFRNPQELSEKISFYLENPSKREEIAKRAYIRVIKEHTFLHRMKEILSILGKR